MQKRIKRIAALILVFGMIAGMIPCAMPAGVCAAAKQEAFAYHGNWTYYTVNNTIYRLNSQTGKASAVKTIKDAFEVFGVSYYKGYLYFTTNYYFGTDASEDWICKMKPDGTSFKKLTRGHVPKVYGDKIYYIKCKHVMDSDGMVYDDDISISEMNLSGKNNKTIEKITAETSVWYLAIAGGRLFYVKKNNTLGTNFLYGYNLDKKNKSRVDEEVDGIINTDGRYLYCTCNNGVKMYDITDGTVSERMGYAYNYFGGKDGKIYYSDYEKRCMYEYNFKTKSKKIIKKNVDITGVVYSRSGYHVYTNYYSSEQFAASNYQYDIEKVRMKINGKGYKVLKKYFVP